MAILMIPSDDRSHTLLIDNTGNQAVKVGNKLIFIGVDKIGMACFRDIHDINGLTGDMLYCKSLEDLNNLIKGYV